jgi:hypothetical protein
LFHKGEREEKMPLAATLVSSDKVEIVTAPSAGGLGHYSTIALAEHVPLVTACALALPFLTECGG